jgi:hypothetical protein
VLLGFSYLSSSCLSLIALRSQPVLHNMRSYRHSKHRSVSIQSANNFPLGHSFLAAEEAHFRSWTIRLNAQCELTVRRARELTGIEPLEIYVVFTDIGVRSGYSRARYALLRFGHTPIAAMYFAQTSSSELEIQGKHAFIYSRVSAERQRARVSTASRSISAFCCRRFSGDKGTSTLCEAAISSPEL